MDSPIRISDSLPRDQIPEPADVTLPFDELRKMLSVQVTLSDWKAVVAEAARLNIPISSLLRRWIGPPIAEIKRRDKPKAA